MDASAREFRSSKCVIDLLAGVGGFSCCISMLWAAEWRWLGVLFLAGNGWLIVHAIRHWHRPVLRFESEKLVLMGEQHAQKEIVLSDVACVRSRFNRTVLEFRDGTRVSIGHYEFMKSEDVKEFKRILAEKVERAEAS